MPIKQKQTEWEYVGSELKGVRDLTYIIKVDQNASITLKTDKDVKAFVKEYYLQIHLERINEKFKSLYPSHNIRLKFLVNEKDELYCFNIEGRKYQHVFIEVYKKPKTQSEKELPDQSDLELLTSDRLPENVDSDSPLLNDLIIAKPIKNKKKSNNNGTNGTKEDSKACIKSIPYQGAHFNGTVTWIDYKDNIQKNYK